MSHRGWLIDKLLPAILFPSFSILAMYFMISHYLHSGAATAIATHCPPSANHTAAPPTPFKLSYTTLEPLDNHLCGIIVFFHGLLDKVNLPFTIDVLVSLSTHLTFPFLEASRSSHSKFLAFPATLGVLIQLFTMGFVYPLYVLAFILTGATSFHMRTHDERTKIDHAHAEATLFALVMGYLIPTAAFFILEDPIVTALWQFFPVWMYLFQQGHLAFRPSSAHPYSGYPTVRATYIILFILSSSYHISIVWPKFLDVALLKKWFVPSTDFLSPTLADGVREFLKWDVGVAFTATSLLTLWFARNLRDLLGLLAWHIGATLLVGPGAALAAVFLWRESLLQGPPAHEIDAEGDKKSQ